MSSFTPNLGRLRLSITFHLKNLSIAVPYHCDAALFNESIITEGLDPDDPLHDHVIFNEDLESSITELIARCIPKPYTIKNINPSIDVANLDNLDEFIGITLSTIHDFDHVTFGIYRIDTPDIPINPNLPPDAYMTIDDQRFALMPATILHTWECNATTILHYSCVEYAIGDDEYEGEFVFPYKISWTALLDAYFADNCNLPLDVLFKATGKSSIDMKTFNGKVYTLYQ